MNKINNRSNRVFACGAWLLLVFSAVVMVSRVCFAQGELATRLAPNKYAPDLQIIVMGGLPGGDQVNVTYPGVPDAIVLRNDVDSLCKQLNVDAGRVHISTEGLPEAGGLSPLMTSVTLTAQGAAPLNTGTLPVDKLILALRSYHRLAVTYILPPTFRYTGFQQYSDRNLKVLLTRRESTYLYAVEIENPNFRTLTLPTSDTVVTPHVAPQSGGDGLGMILIKGLAILVVIAIAGTAGWFVYRALAKIKA